jgi:hypothetical protein
MTSTSPATPPNEGQRYIYRPYIRKPDGTIIWAKTYGKKAFRIPVSDDVANDNSSD